MARARKELDEVPAGLADEIESSVRAARAVSLKKLTRIRLTRRAEAELHETLARRGLERTGKALRVPLPQQLAGLVSAASQPIPTTGLRKQLRGVDSAAELKRVIAELCRAGRAALVVRGGKEHLTLPSPALLAAEEVAGLKAIARALTRAANGARARAGQPPRTLWRPDVRALLAEALASLGADEDGAVEDGGEAAAAGKAVVAEPSELVVGEVRRRSTDVGELVSVPGLARALGDRLEGEAFRQALVSAAMSGRLELRPESGVGLLDPADAALCPRGPDGSALSWVRVVGGGGE